MTNGELLEQITASLVEDNLIDNPASVLDILDAGSLVDEGFTEAFAAYIERYTPKSTDCG